MNTRTPYCLSNRAAKHGNTWSGFTKTASWRELSVRSRWFVLAGCGEKNDCWLWRGCINENGYGSLNFHHSNILAHRIAYELFIGPIPPGLVIDHLCRNKGCVNPLHLEAVTDRVNILRGEGPAAIEARQTHCIHGHELSGENLRITMFKGRTYRGCMACQRQRKPKDREKYLEYQRQYNIDRHDAKLAYMKEYRKRKMENKIR